MQQPFFVAELTKSGGESDPQEIESFFSSLYMGSA